MYVFCLHVCLCKGVGKSNPGPFEEQSVFINAEPSLFSCFLFCFVLVMYYFISFQTVSTREVKCALFVGGILIWGLMQPRLLFK